MTEQLHPVIAAISSHIHKEYSQGRLRQRHPFVTISRETGSGGIALADELVHRLNELDPASPPWTAFDRNLVEKVAADYGLSKGLIESIGESSYNWLRAMFEAMSPPDESLLVQEAAAYRRVAQTILALAHAGRVIIVGRGGAFITESVPMGIHVRLVAPLKTRLRRVEREHGLSESQARQHIQKADERRANFYARYWPERTLDPESFTVTYNTAAMSDAHLADSIIPLLTHLKATAKAQKTNRV